MNWERGTEADARDEGRHGLHGEEQLLIPGRHRPRPASPSRRTRSRASRPSTSSIRKGTIRYRNLGYEEGVEQIIETQLQSFDEVGVRSRGSTPS